jgi:hypothetical protein
MKNSELFAWGLFISFFIVITWTDHPFLALVLGTNGIIPFMQRFFETKYCNRKIFLGFTIVILVLGWLTAVIYTFKWNFQQYGLGVFLAALLSIFTFLVSFSSTRRWDDNITKNL